MPPDMISKKNKAIDSHASGDASSVDQDNQTRCGHAVPTSERTNQALSDSSFNLFPPPFPSSIGVSLIVEWFRSNAVVGDICYGDDGAA